VIEVKEEATEEIDDDVLLVNENETE